MRAPGRRPAGVRRGLRRGERRGGLRARLLRGRPVPLAAGRRPRAPPHRGRHRPVRRRRPRPRAGRPGRPGPRPPLPPDSRGVDGGRGADRAGARPVARVARGAAGRAGRRPARSGGSNRAGPRASAGDALACAGARGGPRRRGRLSSLSGVSGVAATDRSIRHVAATTGDLDWVAAEAPRDEATRAPGGGASPRGPVGARGMDCERRSPVPTKDARPRRPRPRRTPAGGGRVATSCPQGASRRRADQAQANLDAIRPPTHLPEDVLLGAARPTRRRQAYRLDRAGVRSARRRPRRSPARPPNRLARR